MAAIFSHVADLHHRRMRKSGDGVRELAGYPPMKMRQ
jgi:hypothetical protein